MILLFTPQKGKLFLGMSTSGAHAIRCTQARILHAPNKSTTSWPGEFSVMSLPDCELALDPRTDCAVNSLDQQNNVWPLPSTVSIVAGKIRIPNDTVSPLILQRNKHFFAQVCPTFCPDSSPSQCETLPSIQSSTRPSFKDYSVGISLDPDNILSPSSRAKFLAINREFDQVFNSNFTGDKGVAGPLQGVLNMGPTLPRQSKGHLPQYAHDRLVELQEKFDHFENVSVFKRPEDSGIVAEYVNLSFLVKKHSGGNRLVTAFVEGGQYAKPQPSLMPDVDSTLHQIARWKFVITTDLTSAFYQIPLSKVSMKYCSVVTPFRGVRVYIRGAMGMPGSETALEELMCRVLGDLLEGVVAKIADDLYCGGNDEA